MCFVFRSKVRSVIGRFYIKNASDSNFMLKAADYLTWHLPPPPHQGEGGLTGLSVPDIDYNMQ